MRGRDELLRMHGNEHVRMVWRDGDVLHRYERRPHGRVVRRGVGLAVERMRPLGHERELMRATGDIGWSTVLAFTLLAASGCGGDDSTSPPPPTDGGARMDSGSTGTDGGGGTDSTISPADCASFTTCGDCTPTPGCGWCGATSACMNGDTDGPTSGTCASDWAWVASECPCPAATTCEDCTAAGCGWCGGTSTCTHDGDTCTSGWAPFEGYCGPDTECPMATTCAECTRMTVCGWCASAGACSRGTGDGAETGGCASDGDPETPEAGWAWLPSQCESAPDAGP